MSCPPQTSSSSLCPDRRPRPSRCRRSAATWPRCTARDRRHGAGRPRLRPDRARHLPAPARRPRDASSAGRLRARLLAFSLVSCVVAVRHPAAAGAPAVQPDTRRGVSPAPRRSTRGQLRHQHELAELRRRDHDEPPHPDGGLLVQNFVSAAVGHGGRGRADPGPRPQPHAARSATSGSTSSAAPSRILLPLAFVFAVVLVSQGVIQNFHGFTHGHDASKASRADHPRRAGRQPGGDQGARHNGGGFFNVQLRPPVREPDAAHQLPRALR